MCLSNNMRIYLDLICKQLHVYVERDGEIEIEKEKK